MILRRTQIVNWLLIATLLMVGAPAASAKSLDEVQKASKTVGVGQRFFRLGQKVWRDAVRSGERAIKTRQAIEAKRGAASQPPQQ